MREQYRCSTYIQPYCGCHISCLCLSKALGCVALCFPENIFTLTVGGSLQHCNVVAEHSLKDLAHSENRRARMVGVIQHTPISEPYSFRSGISNAPGMHDYRVAHNRLSIRMPMGCMCVRLLIALAVIPCCRLAFHAILGGGGI